MSKVTVAVIAGSTFDRDVVDDVVKTLEEFGVEAEAKVISAHRNPERLRRYVQSSDAEVFIAVAGMAAHLSGAIAALTVKPVIGVPVSAKLGGLDALLSTVEMPSGVPVAGVAIDGGRNAAILAVEILALKNPDLRRRLLEYRERLAEG